MGIRFRKSFKVAPGVKVNIGKKSAGLSIGNKYGGVSVNSKNGARMRASAPGTGISYSKKIGKAKKDSVDYDVEYHSEFDDLQEQTELKPMKKGYAICFLILGIISFLILAVPLLSLNLFFGAIASLFSFALMGIYFINKKISK